MKVGLISIVIPSRNEQFLKRTIEDLLIKSKEDVEIIAVIDGYWPPIDQYVTDPRVKYIHTGVAKGMRNAINLGVALSTGEYILKSDAHCMYGEGYDQILKKYHHDDWVQIPTRLRLDPFTWTLRDVNKPPMNYMFLTYPYDTGDWGGPGLHGREWVEKNKDKSLDSIKIDDCMSFQGSMWFMKRSYFDFLELMDDTNYGSFPQEAQEIGLKCWLSGGRVVRNKHTWYAHWHKGKENGRGYRLDNRELDKGTAYTNRWLKEYPFWHKQTVTMESFINKFWPVPTWPREYAPTKV